MKVALRWTDGAYERLQLVNAGDTQLEHACLTYLSRKRITTLAHALILPPTNIGYEGTGGYAGIKLSGTVARSSAWIIGDKMISPQEYKAAFAQLSADDRYEIDRWLSTAKKQYTIGDEDANQFVRERLAEMDWDDIHKAAVEQGGLKTKWRTEPLFRRHAVTPTGVAFWRLALLLGFTE